LGNLFEKKITIFPIPFGDTPLYIINSLYLYITKTCF